jgi:ferric-dicitrate binding protein FerR (iron transport regulator)
VKSNARRAEEDAESFYKVFLDSRNTGGSALIAWALHSLARTRLLINAALIDELTGWWLRKTPLINSPAPMKHHVTPELRIIPSIFRTFVTSAIHDDETVELLKRALEAQIRHKDYLSSHMRDLRNLYVPRDSEYEDFARFVLSRSQAVAVVSGRKGCGKTAFILDKLRHSQGLVSYMKAQGLRKVSCNGFVMDARTLITPNTPHEDDIERQLSAAIARHIRERFLQHFSLHTHAGGALRIDISQGELEDRKYCGVVPDGAHRSVAATALLCTRNGTGKSRAFRKLAGATTAAEPLTRLQAIASRLHELGLNDIDVALRYFGIEHPDHNFWCALYAAWFRTEQPLLAFDQLESVPPEIRVPLIEAIVKLTSMLTTQSGRHRRRWKIVIALRSETMNEARDVLWKDPTLILLGESTARLPGNLSPLGNPLTPDCMFQIVDQRMRAVAEMYRRSLPANSELVCAAERLREIFRDQWNMCVSGSRCERALLARHCASANIRSALMIAYASCLTALYEERRAVRLRTRDKQPRSRRGELLAWMRCSPKKIAERFKITQPEGRLHRLKLAMFSLGRKKSNDVELTTSGSPDDLDHEINKRDEKEGRNSVSKRTISFKRVAFAASLLFVVALAFVAQDYMESEQVVSTGASQWHHMTLPDGTVVHVDARSRVEVAYTGEERVVHVYEGSAVFEVAKDAERPFIARTHLVDAMAVGTRFGVSIDSGVTTTVSEGVVKVTGRGTVGGKAVMLSAGEELRVSDNALTSPHFAQVDAERKLQWANGQLILGGMTVAEGVEQLNRRNRMQIIVDGPTLGAKVVEFASVKVDSPEAYAIAVAKGSGVTMTLDRENGVIRLSE